MVVVKRQQEIKYKLEWIFAIDVHRKQIQTIKTDVTTLYNCVVNELRLVSQRRVQTTQFE